MKSAFEAYALSLFGHTLLRSLVLKREQAVGKVGIFFAAPTTQGFDGGQVVSLLAFYSNDPSSNPPDAYSFICKICVWKDIK